VNQKVFEIDTCQRNFRPSLYGIVSTSERIMLWSEELSITQQKQQSLFSIS